MQKNIDYGFEEKFHDEWAQGENIENIDVVTANEACTAPEMRFITRKLGDLRGKTVLDFGCGLGEASVYFAIKGAEVTACDLSQGMLNTAQALGKRYNVEIKTFKPQPEVSFPNEMKGMFDVVYVGNLLHHVDIAKTLIELKSLLKDDGVFVSWDPIQYNPIINVYRVLARKMRTPDEHPLTYADIRLFRQNFKSVETRPFWLFTLVVFILMFLTGSKPNQERFWKKVLQDHEKWRPLYAPLEAIDNVLLSRFNFLWPLCWNLVVVAKGPVR